MQLLFLFFNRQTFLWFALHAPPIGPLVVPPLTCNSNISSPPAPPPTLPGSTTVVAGASQHHCSMQVYFLFPVCSLLLFSGLPRLVCMCLRLARNACMPHTATGSGVQVAPSCRFLPLHLNSERILNSAKTLKLSMYPDGACTFLSASTSPLTAGEEWQRQAWLPAVGGATPEAPPLLCFLSLSGFLCMFFFQPASGELFLLFTVATKKEKNSSPFELSQEETRSPCRGPWRWTTASLLLT